MTAQTTGALTKRTPVRSTLRAVVASDVAPAQRTGAIAATAVGVSGVVAATIVGVDEMVVHGSGLIASAWSADAPGIIAGGTAAVIAGAASLQARFDHLGGERDSRYRDSDRARAEGVGIPKRNLFRGIAGVSVVGAGASGILAASAAHSGAIGLGSLAGAAPAFTGVGETLLSVGVVAGVTALGWSRRVRRQLGPPAQSIAE